jgi:hypothetical protein
LSDRAERAPVTPACSGSCADAARLARDAAAGSKRARGRQSMADIGVTRASAASCIERRRRGSGTCATARRSGRTASGAERQTAVVDPRPESPRRIPRRRGIVVRTAKETEATSATSAERRVSYAIWSAGARSRRAAGPVGAGVTERARGPPNRESWSADRHRGHAARGGADCAGCADGTACAITGRNPGPAWGGRRHADA